jgi:hypothetical protein
MTSGMNPTRQRNLTTDDLDPRLRDLLRYWSRKRSSRRWPSRADIDPLDLKPVLGHINMIEAVPQPEGPPRFRYRLFGTEFVFYHGHDLTGHWLDEIADPGFRAELIAMYTGIVQSGEMRMLSYDYMLATGPHRFQALALPLSEDGRSVGLIMVCGLPVAAL